MSMMWDFFFAYWILLFTGLIGVALLVIGVVAGIDEICVQIKRRRYRTARNTRGDAQWTKNTDRTSGKGSK